MLRKYVIKNIATGEFRIRLYTKEEAIQQINKLLIYQPHSKFAIHAITEKPVYAIEDKLVATIPGLPEYSDDESKEYIVTAKSKDGQDIFIIDSGLTKTEAIKTAKKVALKQLDYQHAVLSLYGGHAHEVLVENHYYLEEFKNNEAI